VDRRQDGLRLDLADALQVVFEDALLRATCARGSRCCIEQPPHTPKWDALRLHAHERLLKDVGHQRHLETGLLAVGRIGDPLSGQCTLDEDHLAFVVRDAAPLLVSDSISTTGETFFCSVMSFCYLKSFVSSVLPICPSPVRAPYPAEHHADGVRQHVGEFEVAIAGPLLQELHDYAQQINSPSRAGAAFGSRTSGRTRASAGHTPTHAATCRRRGNAPFPRIGNEGRYTTTAIHSPPSTSQALRSLCMVTSRREVFRPVRLARFRQRIAHQIQFLLVARRVNCPRISWKRANTRYVFNDVGLAVVADIGQLPLLVGIPHLAAVHASLPGKPISFASSSSGALARPVYIASRSIRSRWRVW